MKGKKTVLKEGLPRRKIWLQLANTLSFPFHPSRTSVPFPRPSHAGFLNWTVIKLPSNRYCRQKCLFKWIASLSLRTRVPMPLTCWYAYSMHRVISSVLELVHSTNAICMFKKFKFLWAVLSKFHNKDSNGSSEISKPLPHFKRVRLHDTVRAGRKCKMHYLWYGYVGRGLSTILLCLISSAQSPCFYEEEITL